MRAEDLQILCALKDWPEQRIVHQHPCQPDAHGHICAPEAVFFRRGHMRRRILQGRVNRLAFRRLLKAGLLKRTLAGQGEAPQDEYGLSEAAHARFAAGMWKAAFLAYRKVKAGIV